jgi:HAD superfamily hydrolase (TIGR01509 family)
MFDSRQANVNYYNHLLSHFGLPPMKDEDVDFVHMYTAEESVNYIFRESPYRAAAQEYRSKKLDYTPFIKDMAVEPGLKSVLERLRPHYDLAVATNRSTTIGKVLEHHGLRHYFDIVVSSLDVENPKPHPEPLLKILDFFHSAPQECLYVGDSEVDRQVCLASGVPLVAYRSRNLTAEYYVDNLMDILRIVERASQKASLKAAKEQLMAGPGEKRE